MSAYFVICCNLLWMASTQSLHAGVSASVPLAAESSVLKDHFCDWSAASGVVGVFYRWWKWDTLWQCSLSIFHWSCRRCAAESRSLLAKGGFAAYGLCVLGTHMLKPTKRTLYSFFVDTDHFFFFLQKAFVKSPWHLADNSYYMVMLSVCSI